MNDTNQEDIRKIHNEINQLSNHRFLLSTTAITLFGVITAWQIPKDPVLPGGDIGAFRFSVTTVLLLLLFLLFIWGRIIQHLIITLASYLIARNASQWEIDWREYIRWYGKNWPLNLYSIQTGIFLLLGFLSFLTPIILGYIYDFRFQPRAGFYTVVVVTALYLIFVFGIGFHRWFMNEADIQRRWNEVLKISYKPGKSRE